MPAARKYALSVAGYDPCAGAGALSDIKTFEQHKVYGVAVLTALTLQTESKFSGITWRPEKEVCSEIKLMLSAYPVKVVKIGIVPSLAYAIKVVDTIHSVNDKIKIVLDPVIASGSGFTFQKKISAVVLHNLLKKIYLITPNSEEACKLVNTKDPMEAALELQQYCNVLLKGGHFSGRYATDYLLKQTGEVFNFSIARVKNKKHGTGCVLSSSIAANLANGNSLNLSVALAKKYTLKYLKSNHSLLGYHVR